MRKHRINFLEEHKDQYRGQQKKVKAHSRRPFLILLVIFFVIGATIATKAIFSSEDPTLSPDGGLVLTPKEPGLLGKIKYFVFGSGTKLAGERKDRINVLLLGMGGPGHDGPYLTDTIIIGSIKPSTNEVAMITIPRDLGVDIPDYGWQKINHANAYGESKGSGKGVALAKEVIEDTFDIDIHYHVRVDFTAFQEIVGHVEGLTVDVDRSFVDPSYPAPQDEFQTVSFRKGVQTMDGETALIFARSRHGNNGEGSDFARSRRQLKIILALKDKVLSFETLFSPRKIRSILKSLNTHISTNMDLTDMLQLSSLAKNINATDITTLTLDSAADGFLRNGTTSKGSFILSPRTGNFEQISYTVKHIFDDNVRLRLPVSAPSPTQTSIIPTPPNENVTPTSTQKEEVEPLQPEETILLDDVFIEVQNGTTRAGLAANTKATLQQNNFFVHSVGNTAVKPIPTSAIYITDPQSVDQAIRLLLTNTLDLPIRSTLLEGLTYKEETDVLIVLGENFTP
ncbi:MAG: LCP family protein [Candidatus Magasanikbacteria bacterium]|nr:LCP family protein [Candidatus Magasanikbacteria bacterium]MBT4221520.1 LCP family protein [Candidatus Magasanikbacteria bacterium]MBT4350471.1 LCP family protein [Candidatus Magasanikbacteria bacterium]MBT4541858.1 LCP family protein [Candidatus Magasanikbacteria bacterium]MBT6253117.1 LCP family protein [Candidatus Magasanikbacteria bacterium]